MSIDLTRFHESFFIESLEALDATEAHLLALEAGGTSPGDEPGERVNAIFRAVHSVKGAAGSLGFGPIAEFTHHLESFLDHARRGSVVLAGPTVDALLASVDHARTLLKVAREGGTPDANRAILLIETLKRLSPENPFLQAARGQSPIPPPGVAGEGGESPQWRIRFEPSLDFFRSGNDPLRMFKVLSEMGTLEAVADVSRIPTGEFDPETCYLAWDLTLTTSAPRLEIEDVFAWAGDESRVTMLPVVPAPAAPTPALRWKATAPPSSPTRRATAAAWAA